MTIKPVSSKSFTEELIRNKLGPVVEVPCSYLKDFLNYLWDSHALSVINPANEAVVMGIAAGEYLSTGKIPVVAIQNSGFTNTLNALTSLNQIYNIPVFMMVTWRGEGGVGKDAPEHDITGENLLKYLQAFHLPYEVANAKTYKIQIRKLVSKIHKSKTPGVLVIRKGFFEPYKITKKVKENKLEMTRYGAISEIKKLVSKKTILLSGTGFPSRDSFNVKDTPDFYVMGSMGHVFSIALGVCRNAPKKKVIVLDGDGGALMHAGAFASLDQILHKNLVYVMLDNGLYESTGGQPAPSQNTDFKKFAQAFQFGEYMNVKSKSQLLKAFNKSQAARTPVFLHVLVKPGEHAGVRVSDKYSCVDVSKRFMKQVHE